jgi:molybdate transport system ATP-binding protein
MDGAMSTLQCSLVKTHRQAGGDFRLEVGAHFQPGVTAILGPSGSGKSTWLECLAGLQKPDQGNITLGNRTLFDSAAKYSRQPGERELGYIFQSAALFPHMTVRENVEYGLHALPSSARRNMALQMLELLHIPQLAEKRATLISGGERQRVALARTLVRDPKCLLLDEPFSALDLAVKLRIMEDVLAWTTERSIPVLLVTHALEEVLTMAQRVLVLEQGRIKADGEPREVLAAQRAELVASL